MTTYSLNLNTFYTLLPTNKIYQYHVQYFHCVNWIWMLFRSLGNHFCWGGSSKSLSSAGLGLKTASVKSIIRSPFLRHWVKILVHSSSPCRLPSFSLYISLRGWLLSTKINKLGTQIAHRCAFISVLLAPLCRVGGEWTLSDVWNRFFFSSHRRRGNWKTPSFFEVGDLWIAFEQ